MGGGLDAFPSRRSAGRILLETWTEPLLLWLKARADHTLAISPVCGQHASLYRDSGGGFSERLTVTLLKGPFSP